MKAVPDPRRATLIVVSLASALLLLCRSASAVPTMAPLPEFVATEGSEYVAVLHLDDVVGDPEAADDALTWHVPGGTALDVTLTRDRHLVVRPPDADWFGVEAIPIAVCNPAGACATQTLSFRVEPVPDAPIIDWIPSSRHRRGRGVCAPRSSPLRVRSRRRRRPDVGGLRWDVAHAERGRRRADRRAPRSGVAGHGRARASTHGLDRASRFANPVVQCDRRDAGHAHVRSEPAGSH